MIQLSYKLYTHKKRSVFLCVYPNGTGGISKLSGNRRKPFRARITTHWEYDEKTGKAKQKFKVIGYFATKKEALMALAEYHKDPREILASDVTFADIYIKWSSEAFEEMSKANVSGLKSAFKRCESVHKMKMSDIKKAHLQSILDSVAHMSPATSTKIKTVMKEVFQYCLENEILDKNPAEFVKVKAKDAKSDIHEPYTKKEIQLLWDNLNLAVEMPMSGKLTQTIYPVDIILIAIYTGMRPSEVLNIENKNIHLEEKYLVGGMKTEAGTDRIIPLNDKIIPLVEKRMSEGGNFLIKYKTDNPPKLQQYRKFMYDPIVKALKMEHLPHDSRHTFISLMHEVGIDELTVKRIVGHQDKSNVTSRYTHIEIQNLINAVNKLPI